MRYSKAALRVSLIYAAVIMMLSCSEENRISQPEQMLKGPIADKVIYTVTGSEDDAVRSIINGSHDILLTPISNNTLMSFTAEERKKLEIYTAPSDIRSCLVNPIPNRPPYIHQSPGQEPVFNPFAIQAVRYALNWLINRQYLIDTVFSGDGIPMFTAVRPSLPGAYRYGFIPAKLGMSAQGDEERAFAYIRYAMEQAAALPANSGKLVKQGSQWYFNDKPVTITVIAREDDPEAGIPISLYLATQLEKAGFAIEYKYMELDEALSTVYEGNPADYEWNVYAERWEESVTSGWWEQLNAQMYAPFAGNMPGGDYPEHWNYVNPMLDKLAKKTTSGQYLHAAEYWNACLEVTKLGIYDSVRIYLLAQRSNYIAHKARFNRRAVYGLGEGLNTWTIRTADISADVSGFFEGKKVLRALYCDSRDKLFVHPVSILESTVFLDSFMTFVAHSSNDLSIALTPHIPEVVPLFSYYDTKSLETAPFLTSEGLLTGNLPIALNTQRYDTKANKWVAVEFGETAAGRATGWIQEGYYWHHHEPVTLADIRYGIAFDHEWAAQDSPKDKYYDPAFSEEVTDELKNYKGSIFNANGSITNYYNYFFAPDKNTTAAVIGSLPIYISFPYAKMHMPWEIYEAVSELVAHGGKSRQNYSFSDTKNMIDLFCPVCVGDIKAKLEDFIYQKHIPDALVGLIDTEKALRRYKTSIAFINKYKHAFISNGPFMITSVDPDHKTIFTDAFRSYPYDSEYWYRLFSKKATSIKHITAPQNITKTKDAVYEVAVDQYTFPDNVYEPLRAGKVVLTLQHEDGTETTYQGKMLEHGVFSITIPAADLEKLISGLQYTAAITSCVDDEIPAIEIVQLTL